MTRSHEMAERFHLAWHQSHLLQMLRGEGLWFVLVPAGKGAKLDFFKVPVISDTGRPSDEDLIVNQLQLISVRDPTVESGTCPKEQAVLRQLQSRAAGAAHVLDDIVLTESLPPWARYPSMSVGHLNTLWRAGGAL
jgi:hypothetical protein